MYILDMVKNNYIASDAVLAIEILYLYSESLVRFTVLDSDQELYLRIKLMLKLKEAGMC